MPKLSYLRNDLGHVTELEWGRVVQNPHVRNIIEKR